jgi:SAM-dependent methyltransferase
MISFTCNICGRDNQVEKLDSEPSSCAGCGSNVRLRALIYLLSKELFAEPLILPDFPALSAIRGVGLSDQRSYASRLAEKLDYTNTYYDREPRLDITEPHPERHETYDFILSSDVFEHIAVPVERAFEEACLLLKPHGVLCLTVPSSLDEQTLEHYPDLLQYAVVDLAGTLVLINRKADGTLQIRDNLVFHGGVGATLEMRLFSQRDLEQKLLSAGFETVHFQTQPVPQFGIAFEGKWSLPLVARKREFAFGSRAAGQLVRDHRDTKVALAALREQFEDAIAKLEAGVAQAERLENELAERGQWTSRVQEEQRETAACLERLQAEFDERSRWALQLKTELEEASRAAADLRTKLRTLEDRLEAIARSRWIKLGNQFGVGPKLC